MNSPIALVGLGGIFGSILRYFVATLFHGSPLATIIINLSGCFLIGAISTLINLYHPFNHAYRLFLITGILGSFTTFSTFGLEGFNFLRSGSTSEALFYVGIQVFVGISMVYLGELLVSELLITS